MNNPVDFDKVKEPTCKHYVYFLYLPHKPLPVYVGKGTGRRYKTYYYESNIKALSNHILKYKLEELRGKGVKYKVVIAFR